MCKAGGPRCNGSRKSQVSAGTAVADRPATAPTSSTVPSRGDTDRLAADYPADAKGWDGKPLNDRDRRMYALRDSGWTGPIDQDGYPATTGDGADTLRYMARQRGENPDW